MKPLTVTSAMRAKWKVINAARVADGKPKLNFPLWVKVRNRIAAVPESYDQNEWKIPSKSAPCGTAACLAGETLICSQRSFKGGLQLLKETRRARIGAMAGTLLGLDKGNSANYFDDGECEIFNYSGSDWPEPFDKRFLNANTDLHRAHVAVAYLTSVIRTGKVID